jgi:hypothetical protein
MESQSIPRMVMAGQMFGKRPVGKPKKRWMDAVKEDKAVKQSLYTPWRRLWGEEV